MASNMAANRPTVDELNSGHNFLHAGPINAVNGSNDASWWHSHSICGFVNKKV